MGPQSLVPLQGQCQGANGGIEEAEPGCPRGGRTPSSSQTQILHLPDCWRYCRARLQAAPEPQLAAVVLGSTRQPPPARLREPYFVSLLLKPLRWLEKSLFPAPRPTWHTRGRLGLQEGEMPPGWMETALANHSPRSTAGTRQGQDAVEDAALLPVAGEEDTELARPLCPHPSHSQALLAPALARCPLELFRAAPDCWGDTLPAHPAAPCSARAAPATSSLLQVFRMRRRNNNKK